MTIGTHQLKTHPQYFQAVKKGLKTFECRYNDRNFQENDTLILKEFNPEAQEYTGDELKAVITYILGDFAGLKEGFVVLGIKVIK